MTKRIARTFIVFFALLAILAMPFGQVAVARAAEPEDAYEIVVPLEFNRIYQVSAKHELMVVERYGGYREPQRSLVNFDGDEVLAGTDILLCSDGILCRTREWNEDGSPIELYSFYDWSLTPVFSEISERIVTTDSHYLLLMQVTSTSAHADLSYGERRLYDLDTKSFVMECGYGSDGDKIVLSDGKSVTPDRYGFSAFTYETGDGGGYLSESQMKQITAAGPLAGMNFDMIDFNDQNSCYCADANDLAILRSGDTAKSGVIRILMQATAGFTDIPGNSYCYSAVTWATAHTPKITEGYSDQTFRPDNDVNRGQAVTFLWRAFGCPEPLSLDNPFTDVDSGSPYYKAILWAVENGITNGATPTTFEPYKNASRAHVVTFLWRASGRPSPLGTINQFTDIADGTFYYEAVLWAIENGITQGLTTTKFGPAENCRRGQVVTFLYRAVLN